MSFKLDDWWPWYQKIIRTFGYDQTKDQYAADLLCNLLAGKAADPSALKELITNHPVLVFGAGPSLEENLSQVMKESLLQKFVTIAADGATTAILNLSKTIPNVVVTDLDGVISDIVSAQEKGALIVIHAHGDNIKLLQKYVPDFSQAIGSTQVQPRSNVYNFFGFTDGDRAVFLAAAMGAKAIVLAGMDFGVVVGKYSKKEVKSLIVKQRKLKISKELLEWLAERIQGHVGLYNLTAKGEDIKGFQRIQPQELKNLI